MNSRSTFFQLLVVLLFSFFSVAAQNNTNNSDVATGRYNIKNVSFNSANSDFGIFPFGTNNFFFSSNRLNENGSNEKQIYNYDNQPFLDIYLVNKSSDTLYSEPTALPGNMESRYNEGPVFFDAVSNSFFITRNHFNKKKSQQSRHGVNRLKIYVENIDGTSFKSFEEFQHNSDAYSVGHAALSSDGKKIYFSSDMPGGLGGVDLYVAVKEDDKWGAPKNLGSVINTAGNEMFPFISADNKLYFSSNGHSVQTGLDIYMAEVNGEEFKNLKRLGAPFNSDQDDFSFYVFPGNRSGYLSSNRPGGKGDDDIYFFEQTSLLITGIVHDKKDGSVIKSAKVKIMDDDFKMVEVTADEFGKFSYEAEWGSNYTVEASKEGFAPLAKPVITESRDKTLFELEFSLLKEEYGIQGLILNKDNNTGIAGATVTLLNKTTGKESLVNTDEKGFYYFSVKQNNDYVISVEKTKFVTATLPVSTKGMSIGVKKQDIMLEELVVGKSIKIENVYYDSGKWDIRTDAKVELDKMVTLMNENPSMEIELSSHTDSRGSDAANLLLSDKRAKAVASYIISKGISGGRITGKGYGETKLLNACVNGKKCSDLEHQKNRRTEFTILKIQ